MPPRVKAAHKRASLAETWICEWCLAPAFGTDPPDVCESCAYEYFENGEDAAREEGLLDS